MTSTLKLVAICAIFVIAILAMLFTFGIVSKEAFVDSLRYLVPSLGIIVAAVCAVGMIAKSPGEKPKESESHIR